MAEEKSKPKEEQPIFLERWLNTAKKIWPTLAKYVSIFLYTLEGWLAGIIVAHSANEPIPAELRITWHIVIGCAALLMALVFATAVDNTAKFIREGAKNYSGGLKFIVGSANVGLIFIFFIGAFVTPILTFWLIASLTNTMELVEYAARFYTFSPIGWFKTLQGHNAVVSTFMGTIFHYMLIGSIMLQEVRMIPGNVIPKKEGEDDKEKQNPSKKKQYGEKRKEQKEGK